jgi:hypothetical protein
MSAQSDRRLSIREAAQLIYRVAQPSPQQIDRVRQHITRQELQGDARGTTTAAVADFLARTATLRQRDARRDAPISGRRAQDLDAVYHESLKDFFLAVIFRRKTHGASLRFQRAVVAAQGLVVVGVLTLVIFSARAAFPPLAPERAAVKAWLEANTIKPRVQRWHRPTHDDQGQTLLRVEYRYVTERGKGIDTDRMFVIADGQVVGVRTEW